MSSQNKTSASASNVMDQTNQSKNNSESEATFTIQPHPATTNDPQDLLPEKKSGGGLQTSGSMIYGPGPFIPNREMQQNIGEPLSKEELRARAAELNK